MSLSPWSAGVVSSDQSAPGCERFFDDLDDDPARRVFSILGGGSPENGECSHQKWDVPIAHLGFIGVFGLSSGHSAVGSVRLLGADAAAVGGARCWGRSGSVGALIVLRSRKRCAVAGERGRPSAWSGLVRRFAEMRGVEGAQLCVRNRRGRQPVAAASVEASGFGGFAGRRGARWR